MTDPVTPVGQWLDPWVRTAAEDVAILDAARAWTYADLADCARRWGSALRAAGLRHGDRVATLTCNRAEHFALLFACARSGLVLVPLSWRLTAREVGRQLADAEPAVLVADEDAAELARSAVARVARPPALWTFDQPVAAPAGQVPEPGAVRASDPLLILYTGGTTGRPKGAVLTHAGCAWTNRSLDEAVGVDRRDVVLSVLPQFHVAGWNVQPLLCLAKGARLVLPGRFDPGATLELVARHRVTTMMGVPTTYALLADDPGFPSADLSSLRTAIVGGAACPPRLLRVWRERGVRIRPGYGLTEAGPNVLCAPAGCRDDRPGWAGRPYPHVEVALLDEHDRPAGPGPATGELVVRGPGVFAGYWRDPGATAWALRGGWLHTGDLAERDAEGCYRVRGRLDDVFVSGGENVYPGEVEQVLLEHPGVAEAAVVGVPDERWGEVGFAVVTPVPGGQVTAADLRAHCRRSLAGFKVPARIEVAPALPRTAVGKVLRAELRERFGGPETGAGG